MSETIRASDDGVGGDTDARSSLRLVGVAVGLWLVGFVGANLLSAAPIAGFVVSNGGVPEQFPTWVLLASQAVGGIGFLAVGGAYAWQWLGGLDVARPDRSDLAWTGFAVAGSIAVWLVLHGGSTLVGIDAPTSVFAEQFGEPSAMAALAVLTVFVAAPAEEVLFRGAIQRRLRLSAGPWPSIAGASVLFLGIHLLNFSGGSAAGLAVAFGTLLGVSLLLGYAYERSENLAVPILAHGAYNAIVAGVSVLALLGWP